MIHHIVMFKLKPGTSKDSQAVKDVFATLQSLPQTIPQICGWECGMNIAHRPIAYDVGLYSTFDNEQDLATYVAHPDHQAMIGKWREIADWNIADWAK